MLQIAGQLRRRVAMWGLRAFSITAKRSFCGGIFPFRQKVAEKRSFSDRGLALTPQKADGVAAIPITLVVYTARHEEDVSELREAGCESRAVPPL